MSNLNRYAWTSLFVAGLLCGSRGNLQAGEQPGMFQISDSPRPITEPNPLPVSIRYVVDSPQYGTMQPASTAFLGAGPPIGEPGTVWLPSVHPVQRVPVIYEQYWPRHWYGMPGGGIAADAPRAPVIYLPTDTTQMGYYYQRAPRWVPRPGTLPPRPDPWSLHQYTPPPAPSSYAPLATEQHEEPGRPGKQNVVPPAPKDDLNKSALHHARYHTVQ